MKLEINYSNFKRYLKTLSLNKKAEMLICIPTFNSFSVTKSTIESYLKQKNVKFDLLITGPSGDIEELAKFFPEINFCITYDNYGSSGNQLLNLFICKFYKYKFFSLTDNDAVLLDEFGLDKMLNLMKKRKLVWVYPILNNIKLDEVREYSPPVFHCCLFSSEIYKNNDYFFNPNYFLLFDDVSFGQRIDFCFFRKHRYANVRYYHPIKLHVMSFDLKYSFFCTRSILIYLFREKFPLNFKITFKYLRPAISILVIFFLKYRFDYIKIFYESLIQVIKDDYNLDVVQNLKNKINYIELSKEESISIEKTGKIKLIENPYETIFPPKMFKFMDADNNFKYFKRIN